MAQRKQYRGKRTTKGDRYSKDEVKSDQFKNRRTKECANDPAWYTVNGQMLKDVATINFNNPSGIWYNLSHTGASTGKFMTPGVMNIYMAPTAGYSEGLTSPINIAAKNIYSFVRHANSGHANYDSPDLMLMILAMANAYAYYAWMTRVYGLLRVYSQDNRYLGDNLVKACHCDADNLRSNLANFRTYINQYALKLSSLSVPSTMSLFKRYMWMFANVYMDEDDTKAQLYMYQPAYFLKYNEDSGGAGFLEPVPWCLDANGSLAIGTMKTIGAIITMGDTLLGALIGSEDINIMSGDILKAYGNDNIWKLATIDETYAIAPIFSEEVLMQIHNTTFVGRYPLKSTASTSVGGWDSFAVTQDTSIGEGCLICKPLVRRGANIQAKHLLDYWKHEVPPELVMVGTRNMVSGMLWPQGFTAITGFGSEIPMYAAIVTLDGTAGAPTFQYFYDNDNAGTFNATFATASSAFAYYSKLQVFNEHPQFYLLTYDDTSGAASAEIDAKSSIGELSNYTVIDFDDLEKMHLTAILSELAVPLLGNFTK